MPSGYERDDAPEVDGGQALSYSGAYRLLANGRDRTFHTDRARSRTPAAEIVTVRPLAEVPRIPT